MLLSYDRFILKPLNSLLHAWEIARSKFNRNETVFKARLHLLEEKEGPELSKTKWGFGSTNSEEKCQQSQLDH
jgi:hypothetical protein